MKIYFTDFWPNFDKEDNFFTQLLRSKFDFHVSPENPDYLFYSVFGIEHLKFNCIKVFFTGENVKPDLKNFDYSLSFDFDDYGGRNFRLPLYALFNDVKKLLVPKVPEEILNQKTGFCSFVYSNAASKTRNRFFKKLFKYKKVDSGGRVYNNLGYRVSDKLDFISKYKFNIAFENEEYPGYTSEKIFEPMLVNTIPIYWGNPLISKDFNTKSFVNYYDYRNEDELIEKIIEIDKNDSLYLEMLNQPYFENNRLNEYVDENCLLEHFEYIFSKKIEPISGNSPYQKRQGFSKDFYYFNQNLKFKANTYRKKLRNLSLQKIGIKISKMLGK